LKSDPACLPCAIAQGLRAARAATSDPLLLPNAVSAVLDAAAQFDLEDSPAANATCAVKAVCETIQNPDPYREAKREQNRLALKLYQSTKKVVEDSADRIETALLVSCFGNVIDLGAQDSFDLEKELTTLFERGFARSDLAEFKDRLETARSILLVADNSGEIVFDKALLEELPSTVRKTIAVKSGPIINDATVEDALKVGLDRVARIITTGSDDLGVNQDRCSPEFLSELDKADLVLAKGHANFETLNELKKGVFFLLKAKCDIVARELGVKTGSLVFAQY